MNNKKLTIEHLAIAMANNQKVRYYDEERCKYFNCRITELRDSEMTIVSEDGEYEVYFYEVVLICHPLSGLTKEIEHNGERFVPIEITGIIDWEYGYEKLPYWLIQKLFEWHFDVFGLIGSNLAIDINTITETTK
jgi:hypothetical protein